MSHWIKNAGYCLILAAVYVVAGKVGLSLAYVNASATAVWPPTGVVLAALLLGGVRLWPGVFVGAFLANVAVPGSIGNDLLVAGGNTFEGLIGFWLVTRFARGTLFPQQVSSVITFAVLAGLLATAVSATIGVTSLCLFKEAHWPDYPQIWSTWWLGDMMSNLIIAPFLIIWRNIPRWNAPRIGEALLCLATTVAIDLFVFSPQLSLDAGQFKYMAFLPILWAAFRFGPHGAVTSTFVTASLALWVTLKNAGPFATPNPNISLLLLQIYSGALTLTGLVVAAIVCERLAAEERLEYALTATSESEERERARAAELQTIMQAVPAFIWIAQDAECRVIKGNPASYEILRQPRAANLSKTAVANEGPKNFEVHSKGVPLSPHQLPVQRAARGEEIRDFEEEIRFSDGSARFLFGNATPLRDVEGKITGAVAAFVDITDRKKAEQALQAREADLQKTVEERTVRLRETVNELQTLSYSIAHDMRGPLRAMSAFAEILLEDSSALSPEGQDYCARIVKGAARLDRLIQDALNYTKTVLQELPLEPVDIGSLLRGLVDTYPNLHPENAQIEIASELPIVLGNEALLVQCFANLLGNAVKFVPRGQKPCIRVFGDRDAAAHAIISVQDNGIGIAKEHQAKLFGMFHKLDQSYEGTGIGLAIVRKVVERMNGEVGVESEVGSGSRFWVRLPLLPSSIKK